ncbi:hypothetical protein L7F22_018481 [Adiantum nelumboides]|nr:hypothetical protein [Adiantum nelumboides]
MDDADYDIDIQESSSTSSNEEEDDAHIHTQVEWEDATDNEPMLIDVTKHISSSYFAFDRDAYSLMITSLQEDTTMSLHALKMIDHRGMLDLKKWRKIKEVLCLREVENCSLCICLKADPSTRIACMEDWQDIVEGVHCMDGGSCHRDLANTLEALRSTWCIGVRHYGIPISFINDFVNSCGCIHQKKINVVTQCSLDLNKLPSYIISTLKSNLDFQLEQLMFEHKVRLVMVRSAKRRQSSTLVIDYICHRGGKPKRCGSEKKRIRTSKKCGCPFKVQVQSSDDKDEVTIHIYPNHDGHVSGTKSDLYHLPIHPSVMECCAQDLFDIGSSRHVAQMSVSKEKYHLERAAMLDQTIFRFFMIPKEVQMLSYKKCIEGRIPNDDWATMHIEVAALQKQQKVVVYFQPYNPTAQNPKDKPFILIIQDNWMLQMAKRFSFNNAWAIDSTFKTNVFGLPLFAAVLPNQLGQGIPLWFMLCTTDAGAHHDVIALEMTLRIMFSRLGSIRPAALVIDKSQQELETFLKVINEDPHCWESQVEGPHHQIACHIILCWFHAKKAWVENLLPQVLKELRGELYMEMSNLMQCSSEVEFDSQFQRLLDQYSNHLNVVHYVTNGWCGKFCIWRSRRPKFGRLFPHGNVDTTNLIERLWQYIKYTLLEARINRSIVDLIHALVGDSKTGNRMGGTLLKFFMQKQEIADSGRFGLQGSSQKHTSKLREGEAILQRYMLDQSSLVIINESSLQFKIQSSNISNQWYNVSLQANYCDCPDWSSECKHLYGIWLIATRYFQHLSDVLLVVDKAHEMMDTMGDDTCDDINQEQDAIECLQDIKKIVESLERGLSNRLSREMDIVMHQLKFARDTLGSLMSPEQIQLPMRGSIRQVQAHVTQTRLGHGKCKVNVESLDERGIKEPITQPEKPTRQTGILRRKHQRGRSRV